MGTETQTIFQQTVGYSWHCSVESERGAKSNRIKQKVSLGGHTMTKDEAFSELSEALSELHVANAYQPVTGVEPT